MQAIVAILLVGLLTACGATGQVPGKQLIKRAIAIEVSETQQVLSEQLRLSDAQPTKFEINRVEITEQTPIVIQGFSAYRVRGTYDLTLNLPKHQVRQQKNLFDLYLQRQKEGKTWRLARLRSWDDATGAVWVTRLVPPG